MLEILHIAGDDAPILERREGPGTSRELLVWPPADRETFDLRVSLVDVEGPGPFATLPGYERLLVVTRGAGMVLAHGDERGRARLRRLEVYPFPGDWRTSAELEDGSITALNITTRRGIARPRVEVLRLGTRQALLEPEGDHALLLIPTGAVVARVTDEEDPFELAANDALWLRGLVGGEELAVQGCTEDSEVLLVSIGS